MRIRQLTTIDECRAVAALERAVWGYTDAEDVVPPPVLVVSVKRGAILLGACDEPGTIQGVVFSLPALKQGRPTQWSHLLAVAPAHRGSGLGLRLKLAQRLRALEMGIALIEWTYDPLQAGNAHLNFARLGVVVEEYEENIYGTPSSPLHGGTPTDRFVAAWRLGEPHVERRVSSRGPLMRDRGVSDAPIVNAAVDGRRWRQPGAANLEVDARRILVEIPANFSEIQSDDPRLALAWRLSTREIFQAYFHRGYRAVDFFVAPDAGRGHYLLTRS